MDYSIHGNMFCLEKSRSGSRFGVLRIQILRIFCEIPCGAKRGNKALKITQCVSFTTEILSYVNKLNSIL